jgi:hypothetical protein
MAFGIVSWLVFVEGPMSSDDAGFMQVAQSWTYWMDHMKYGGPYNSHYGYRIGLIFPLYVLQAVLPYKLAAYYVFAFCAYALCYVCTYLIGQRLFSTSAAAFSCVLFGSSYFLMNGSSHVMSDHVSAGFALLSFLFFLYALDRDRKALLLVTLSALAAFYAYWCKVSSALFFSFVPLLCMSDRKRWLKMGLFAAVFGVLLLVEFGLHWMHSGEPLARVKTVMAIGKGSQNVLPVSSVYDFLARFPAFVFSFRTGITLGVLGLAGVFVALQQKVKGVLPLLLGALVVTVFHAYSFSSLSPLRPTTNTLSPRFYLLLFAVLCMFSGYIVAWLLGAVSRLSRTPALVASMVVIALVAEFQFEEQYERRERKLLWGQKDRFLSASAKFGEFEQRKPEIEAGKVYCLPARTFRMYPYFDRLDFVDAEKAARPEAPCYVLVDRRAVDFYREHMALLEIPSIANHFLPMIRPSKYYDKMFDYDDIVFAKVARWVERKEAIFDLLEAIDMGVLTVENIIISGHARGGQGVKEDIKSQISVKGLRFDVVGGGSPARFAGSLVFVVRGADRGIAVQPLEGGEALRVDLDCAFEGLASAGVNMEQVNADGGMVQQKTILYDKENLKTHGKRKNGRNAIYEFEVVPDLRRVRFDFEFCVEGNRASFVLERFTLSRFVE